MTTAATAATATTAAAAAATQRRYHHGDLRASLIEQGVELARHGGPAAVQLRDAARRAGVSHNAGYRHFASRDDYLDAVATRGMAALARAMEAALAGVPADLDPLARARARLSATGRAYVDFALAEPGLFRTAFATHAAPESGADVAEAKGAGGLDPYELLVRALDDLADVGALPAERRAHSEIVAWAAVHGLAELLLDGPLHGAAPADVDALWQRLDGAVLRGL